jgi:hypothetical protein
MSPTDGRPDPISLFQSFRSSDDRNPLSTQNPGSQYTDGSLDPCHVSPQTDGLDLSRDLYHGDSRSPVIVIFDFLIANIPIPVGTFAWREKG